MALIDSKIFKITNSYPLILQLTKFGIVGIAAAIVNLGFVILFVEIFSLHPLIANIFAFIIAFNVSYLGHSYLSFAAIQKNHRQSMPKFFIVATTSFLLNEGLYALFLHCCKLNYILALLLVLTIVPIYTFTISKIWAFSPPKPAAH